MEYNLKKENRKKFQDKSKLKRHHKKDFSKVIPKTSTENTPKQETDIEAETEYEDVSEPELDSEGNFVLREDEIEDINEEGQRVVRRKKIDKFKTNVWRYRNEDSVQINGLDQDEEEFIKSIDFKKLDFNAIDFKKEKRPIDYKKLDKDELNKISIVDERYDKPVDSEIDSDDDIEKLLASTARAPSKSTKTAVPPHSSNSKPQAAAPSSAAAQPAAQTSKTPAKLKSDEAFLDDLII